MRGWCSLRPADPAAALTFMQRRFAQLLALLALVLTSSAFAGNVSFGLSLNGSELVVTNQGNTSAFYPAVFRLRPDNSWAQLKAVAPPAELAPGAHLQLVWPDTAGEEALSEIVRMQPVMVRFFDQAGVGFGQLSFFRAAAPAPIPLKAEYVGGSMRIEPPEAGAFISASWVLWGQEDGIRPIRQAVKLEHKQPPALRIDWQRQGRESFQIDTGAGLPAVSLLHQTAQGFVLQSVSDGGLQGREQRAVWLNSTAMFYGLGALMLVLGASALLLQFLRRPQLPVVAAAISARGTTQSHATPVARDPVAGTAARAASIGTGSAAPMPTGTRLAKKPRGKSRRANKGQSAP